MLSFLINDRQLPMTMTKKEARIALNISQGFLEKLIDKGLIKESAGKIAIGSIASYLCG